ncbi:hypothetical protein Pelo_11833 [Pelomyxa schiedti]|nr:hypothetical protein Pelo_11833 [Pelomyxa schiedti]
MAQCLSGVITVAGCDNNIIISIINIIIILKLELEVDFRELDFLRCQVRVLTQQSRFGTVLSLPNPTKVRQTSEPCEQGRVRVLCGSTQNGIWVQKSVDVMKEVLTSEFELSREPQQSRFENRPTEGENMNP